MAGEVRYDRQDAVVTLTIDNRAARNAMTWEMYEQLAAACDRIAADRSVRVVVLRGAGHQAVVAGTDISQFLQFATGQDGLRYEEQMEAVTAKLEQLRQPTVAVIEGYAVGAE